MLTFCICVLASIASVQYILFAYTSNLSKAHMTHDSSGLATWAIVYSMQ